MAKPRKMTRLELYLMDKGPTKSAEKKMRKASNQAADRTAKAAR